MQDELPVDKRKGLEADFHSASYNVLSELVTGLRTAAGYLYQVRNTLYVAMYIGMILNLASLSGTVCN